MLSFFSKKKQSPDTQPEEIIKGPENNGDDFIIIEGHQPSNAGPQSVGISMPMLPVCPYPPAEFGQRSMGNQYIATCQNPTSYLLDIPFNFSPQLNTKNNFEITQMEVDGILALMTKQMQIEIDYDFNLERAILSDSY